MIKKMIENAGLAMRKSPKLKLISHINHIKPFLELCKDVEVGIGEFKTRYSIFVVQHGDYDLIFGQILLNTLNF